MILFGLFGDYFSDSRSVPMYDVMFTYFVFDLFNDFVVMSDIIFHGSFMHNNCYVLFFPSTARSNQAKECNNCGATEGKRETTEGENSKVCFC